MLPKLPKLFSKQTMPLDPNFLVAVINPEFVQIGFFSPDGNSASLVASVTVARSVDLFAVLQKALSELARDNPNLPDRIIIGLGDPRVQTSTTIARLKMDKKSSEVTSSEIEKILTQVGRELETKTNRLFFSSITSSVLDGVRVGNPIGARGSHLEVGCFNAYLVKDELDFYDKLVSESDISLEKLVPCEYSIVRNFLDSGTKDGILLYVGKGYSSVSFVEDSNIIGIAQFSLGSSRPDYWVAGLGVALGEFRDHPRWPTLISFYDTDQTSTLEKQIQEHIPLEVPKLKELHFENLNSRLEVKEGTLTLHSLSVEGLDL